MARKVIIDCAPGIDDAVALTIALFDPRLEVIALTATEGQVPAKTASRNVQAILEYLDPPRLPRMGTASPLPQTPAASMRKMHGDDGLGGCGLAVAQLHQQHPSDKILCDEIRSAPGQVTVVCLGPLTNIARAFKRDPGIVPLVDRLIMAGGAVGGIGNISPAAEFNMYCDPESAREVFRSPTTKTLVPLDCTRKVPFTLDMIDELPPDSCRAGSLLRRVIAFYFRAYHETFGEECIFLHRTIALVAALHPELFDTREMAGDVETRGELTTGATIFDRRQVVTWRTNLEVAMDVDAASIRDCLMRGLAQAGKAS